MKKVSIAVAKQNRNFSEQKLTIGLDLRDRNSWYCVMDEAGHIQLEQRVQFRNCTINDYGQARRIPFWKPQGVGECNRLP